MICAHLKENMTLTLVCTWQFNHNNVMFVALMSRKESQESPYQWYYPLSADYLECSNLEGDGCGDCNCDDEPNGSCYYKMWKKEDHLPLCDIQCMYCGGKYHGACMVRMMDEDTRISMSVGLDGPQKKFAVCVKCHTSCVNLSGDSQLCACNEDGHFYMFFATFEYCTHAQMPSMQ